MILKAIAIAIGALTLTSCGLTAYNHSGISTRPMTAPAVASSLPELIVNVYPPSCDCRCAAPAPSK